MLSVWLYLLSPQGDAGTYLYHRCGHWLQGFTCTCLFVLHNHKQIFWLYKQPQMLAVEAKEKVKRGKRTHMAVTGFR